MLAKDFLPVFAVTMRMVLYIRLLSKHGGIFADVARSGTHMLAFVLARRSGRSRHIMPQKTGAAPQNWSSRFHRRGGFGLRNATPGALYAHRPKRERLIWTDIMDDTTPNLIFLKIAVKKVESAIENRMITDRVHTHSHIEYALVRGRQSVAHRATIAACVGLAGRTENNWKPERGCAGKEAQKGSNPLHLMPNTAVGYKSPASPARIRAHPCCSRRSANSNMRLQYLQRISIVRVMHVQESLEIPFQIAKELRGSSDRIEGRG